MTAPSSTRPSTPSGAPSGGLDGKRLVALIGFFALGVIFWHSSVLLPLKLLVVMMHESGHALATLLVGGHIQRVVIASDQSGACISAIPPGFFDAVTVYSAGYLGSAVAGSLLLILTFRFGLRRTVLVGLAIWLLGVGIFLSGNAFTLGFCAVMAVVLLVLARYLKASVVEWLNLFLAAFSSLYAVLDLRDDLWNGAVRGSSDAGLLAHLTHVPAVVWAVLWSLFALVLLGISAYWSLKRRRRASAPTPAGRAAS